MNSSLYHKIFFSILCFFATSSLFCAEESKEIIAVPVRPVVQGEIYLDHGYNVAMYTGKNYHKKLTQMGIPSCIQNPVMSVMILGVGKNENKVDWTEDVPHPIQTFECAQYKAQGIVINETILSKILQKKLPSDIPAIYLCGAKTGTVLYFTIHNYPVQLTCCDNPVTKKSFKEDFDRYIASFVGKPSCFDYHFEDSVPGLVKHELVRVQGPRLIHGQKGFVSMEKTIKESMEKNPAVSLLLLPFLQEKSIRDLQGKAIRELMGKNAEVILLLWPFCKGN